MNKVWDKNKDDFEEGRFNKERKKEGNKKGKSSWGKFLIVEELDEELNDLGLTDAQLHSILGK